MHEYPKGSEGTALWPRSRLMLYMVVIVEYCFVLSSCFMIVT